MPWKSARYTDIINHMTVTITGHYSISPSDYNAEKFPFLIYKVYSCKYPGGLAGVLFNFD